jgi:hypothetical protein
LGIGLAVLALYAYPVCRPVLFYDDFQMVARSLTWERVRENLWVPANEHAMPLGRVSTWALLQLAGRPTRYPLAVSFHGPLALLVGLGLVYLFVRRELGHPFYGLAAVLLFGVTSVYEQSVAWFASSFSVPALDGMLLALLAAQEYRLRRLAEVLPAASRSAWMGSRLWRAEPLLWCILWCALAPAWFASGILAGPFCCLYLLSPDRGPFLRRGLARAAIVLAPLAGAMTFLLVSLPRTAEHILHLPHYGGKTALQAFDPVKGLGWTTRSIVDNLVPGLVGVSGVLCPAWLVPAFLVLFAAGIAWWWRPVPCRRLLVLGLGMILLAYLLVYSARSEWSYDGAGQSAGMNTPTWGRYHLIPQLGLTFLIVGGLPRWEGRRLLLNSSGRLSGQQTRVLAALTGVLFLVQFPRALFAVPPYDPAQQAVLAHIEEVDARCRECHIDAATARAALGRLMLPLCSEEDNGWDLLQGSPDPRPVSLEEARRLLAP